MGNGATRSLERVAAAMGELESAPIEFQSTCDVAQGGVLLALPALLAAGLLCHTAEFYQLPKGFYGIESIFLLLGLMALARIRSLEQLRYQAPGEWGKLVGLDRIPEVRTLRAKLKLLCQNLGRAMRWNAQLAKDWIARQNDAELYFYCDGHVRVYHGDQTALPRHYVARERLCLRATTDYWINAMDGQPFLYVNKEVDPGLIATLQQDVIPWLEASVAKTPEQERRLAEDARTHWFTLVFDREGYSPELFAQMWKKRIAILSYHKFPQDDWPREEFTTHGVLLAGGETVTMQLAERGSQLSNKLWLREIRKLTDSGHQTSILTTNFQAPMTTLAVSLFARWSQENFFRYMREHYSLDRLIEYGTEPIPDAISVVNPAWRKLDSQIRSQAGQRYRLAAQFGALALSEQGTLAGRDSGSGFGDRQPQTTAEENRASHSSEVPAGGRPLHAPTHGTQALHRHSQDDRLSCRIQHGVAARRAYGTWRRRCPCPTAPDLPDRSGPDTRLGCQHPDGPAPPSHPSCSRSGHRTTARRPQCHADGISWHQAHFGLQTRVILISPRSGGLNVN